MTTMTTTMQAQAFDMSMLRGACPVVAAFVRRITSTSADDEERMRLLFPLAAKLAGSRATLEVEHRRAYVAIDWSVREVVPAWLDRVQLADHATTLRALAPVVDRSTAQAALKAAVAAEDAAEAAGDAASGEKAVAFYNVAKVAGAAADAAEADHANASHEAARSVVVNYDDPTAQELVVEQQAGAVKVIRRMLAMR